MSIYLLSHNHINAYTHLRTTNHESRITNNEYTGATGFDGIRAGIKVAGRGAGTS